MAQQQTPKDQGKGIGEPGWTEAEKGLGAGSQAADDAAAGAAGEAQPKGRPSDERAKTEGAAASTGPAAKP